MQRRRNEIAEWVGTLIHTTMPYTYTYYNISICLPQCIYIIPLNQLWLHTRMSTSWYTALNFTSITDLDISQFTSIWSTCCYKGWWLHDRWSFRKGWMWCGGGLLYEGWILYGEWSLLLGCRGSCLPNTHLCLRIVSLVSWLPSLLVAVYRHSRQKSRSKGWNLPPVWNDKKDKKGVRLDDMSFRVLFR